MSVAVSQYQRDLPRPPPRHTHAGSWVCINRSGRLDCHSNLDSLGRRKDARIANWIWQLLLGEEHQHADWISDPGAGMPAGCAAAAAAAGSAAGSDGGWGSHHILRTTRIQLYPIHAPQAHHTHGELIIRKVFSTGEASRYNFFCNLLQKMCVKSDVAKLNVQGKKASSSQICSAISACKV